MKFLFINSMSRTGTSLLYQLLYGHREIYFAPYRIQFACATPFGFPLTNIPENNEQFFKMLMTKTTIVSKKGEWPQIHTASLSELFPDKMDSRNLIMGDNPLQTAIRTIHHILGIDLPSNEQYYCLHDDHSYMLGSEAFLQYDCKILTTLRNPIDMIASKKNMLTMYVYGRQDPQQFCLKDEVLYKELLRACFSWWAASYEYAHHYGLPVLFGLLKTTSTRKEMMDNIADYLGIAIDEVLLDDKTPLADVAYHNELLANGSSLNTIAYLTKGAKEDNTKAHKLSLNAHEYDFLLRIVDNRLFESLSSSVENFIQKIAHLYIDFALNDLKGIFALWQKLYRDKCFGELFVQYSALNFGHSNAQDAFILSQEKENTLDSNILINTKDLSSTSCGGGGRIGYDYLSSVAILFILYASCNAIHSCLKKRDSYGY